LEFKQRNGRTKIMIKENIDIEELIEMHQKNNLAFLRIEINDTEFHTWQLEFLHNAITKSTNFQYYIKVIFKYKTSRRKALIVLLEEDFHYKNEYNDIDLDKYEAKAHERFSICQSSKKDLDTPTKIHPKNPCLYFKPDKMVNKKRQYREALEDILETPFQFFEIKEAIETLTNTSEKIKYC
jgi:hypothetical protein